MNDVVNVWTRHPEFIHGTEFIAIHPEHILNNLYPNTRHALPHSSYISSVPNGVLVFNDSALTSLCTYLVQISAPSYISLSPLISELVSIGIL